MLGRFELFNDQTFHQNNRQDLNQSLLLFRYFFQRNFSLKHNELNVNTYISSSCFVFYAGCQKKWRANDVNKATGSIKLRESSNIIKEGW
jgi:hypothetical protein